MRSVRTGLLLLLGGAMLCCIGGCAGAGERLPPPDVVGGGGTEPAAYRLRVGDVVEVVFAADRDLNYATPVTPAGTISVPSGGEVPAAGLTVAELAEEIERGMTGYLLDPSAAVMLIELGEQPVYVLGEVGRPGPVAGIGRISVSMALAHAGGLLPGGKPSSVMIVRTTGVPEATAFKVDVTKILSGRDLSQDVLLEPYDVVYVPKSVIGKAGEFVDLFFNNIAPAQLFYLRGYDIANRGPLRIYE